jgi:hypothetical protein
MVRPDCGTILRSWLHLVQEQKFYTICVFLIIDNFAIIENKAVDAWVRFS